MDGSARKAMPALIARQLRQEAGFGCCKCGCPILQYHHIVPWSEDQHFRPEDMMVLCPTHHDQASKGAMPVGEQREFKSTPHNIKLGRALGELEVKQSYCAADLSTITVVGEGPFIRINGNDILSLYMGPKNLELSLKVYSEANDLLVEIDRNEWVSGDPMPWDIEADWQKLVLREKARKISISLDAKKIPLQLTGEFWHSNKKVTINKDGILVHGRATIGLANLALVGGGVDVDIERVRVSPSDGVIISWENPRERLWKARAAWEKMKKPEGPPQEEHKTA
jgi:hypothetical protein